MRRVCPVVVSASRATDIPAFHADWLLARLRAGSVPWVNPFNARQRQVVSFERTRVLVFWTKNPGPLMRWLPELDAMGLHYYFHFTLNDYEGTGFEQGVPSLGERVERFIELSERVGGARVIWRFDPLLLPDGWSVGDLLERVGRLGELLHPWTEQLVFSFADIGRYRRVRERLSRSGVGCRELDEPGMLEAAEGLSELNKGWGLRLSACAEAMDLSCAGVERGRCVDDRLMIRLFGEDDRLLRYFREGCGGSGRGGLKDRGQRPLCGCVASKDIGRYGSCGHGCLYCYAGG